MNVWLSAALGDLFRRYPPRLRVALLPTSTSLLKIIIGNLAWAAPIGPLLHQFATREFAMRWADERREAFNKGEG